MPMQSLKLPDDLSTEIEKMAEKAGVSVEKQAEILPRSSLGHYTRKETLLEAALRISAMTPDGIKQSDSTLLIREARDR